MKGVVVIPSCEGGGKSDGMGRERKNKVEAALIQVFFWGGGEVLVCTRGFVVPRKGWEWEEETYLWFLTQALRIENEALKQAIESLRFDAQQSVKVSNVRRRRRRRRSGTIITCVTSGSLTIAGD